MKRILCALALTALVAAPAFPADEPYIQTENVVYGQSHGVGLLADVFVPTGRKNGLGVIDIASGAWFSDRGKIRDHKMARVYDHFCGAGYTVFAVRPGSVTRYTAEDMIDHLKQAIAWIRENAEEYDIDPDRLALTGASAGGHLSLMTLLKGAPENDAIVAAGIFFPPTNFLDWGDEDADLARLGNLFFLGGQHCDDEQELRLRAEAASPALLIQEALPPIILFHGDADPVVPLQQSELLVERLKEVGSDVEFHIKPGGAHPWLTIQQEVKLMVDWFDATLAPEPIAADD